MRSFIRYTVLVASAAIFSVSSLIAQSGSLYGMSLDESAVLVRVINLRSEGAASLRLGSDRITAAEPGSVSSYFNVAADLYILRYQGDNREFIPRQGTIYSIIAGDDGLDILADEPHSDPLRCQIYAYVAPGAQAGNGWDEGISIRTADGGTVLIDAIRPGTSGAVAVNPVAVELAVFSPEGRRVSEVFDPGMNRGASIALTIRPDGNGNALVTRAEAGIRPR
jgi:hypothetical protein